MPKNRMTISKKFLGKLVRIVWLDSIVDGGWVYDDWRPHIPSIVSYGTVMYLDEKLLTFASTIGKKGGMFNPVTIPVGSVVEIKEI